MERKKSKKSDIERDKPLFFGVGLIISLSLSLIAFEWSSAPQENGFRIPVGGENIDTEITPNTVQAEPEPEPMKPQAPDIIEIVKEVTKPGLELKSWIDVISQDYSMPKVTYVAEIERPEEQPVLIASEMPMFKGGDLNDFSAWVQKHIKYPPLAAEIGVQEKIFITFIVERDGSVTGVEILRGDDQSLRDEVLRVMGTSPKWTPGRNLGLPVRVRFSMVVNFRLQ